MPRPMSISNSPAAKAWKDQLERTKTSPSLDMAVKRVEELGAKQRAERDARTREDEKDKLEKAKKMKVEMIDPALAITGGVAAGVVAGNLINRIRNALDLRKEIKKAEKAADRPIKMPPMRPGPRK